MVFPAELAASPIASHVTVQPPRSMTAPPRPLRLFFELPSLAGWYRTEWERLLENMAPFGGDQAELVDHRDAADCIVTTSTTWNYSPGGRVFGRLPRSPGGPPHLVWDAGDHPAGREPGFYCSLPRPLFDRRRHRTLCYPLCYNECVQPADLSDAQFLFGFVGGITSGLRARLFATLRRQARPGEMQLEIVSGPWKQMFHRAAEPAKQGYAEALRRSRFFLCPRGNGVGTIRLFETMQSARVPVIISDDYVLPSHIDWDSCSVRLRERDLDTIATVLRARAGDWPRLAHNARKVWKENFSSAGLLPRIGRELRELLAAPAAESPLHQLRLAQYWFHARARRLAGRLISIRP